MSWDSDWTPSPRKPLVMPLAPQTRDTVARRAAPMLSTVPDQMEPELPHARVISGPPDYDTPRLDARWRAAPLAEPRPSAFGQGRFKEEIDAMVAQLVANGAVVWCEATGEYRPAEATSFALRYADVDRNARFYGREPGRAYALQDRDDSDKPPKVATV